MKQALDNYCSELSGGAESSVGPSREIIVSDGEVVDDIIKYSREHNCDMIIMGPHRGMLANVAVGSTVKWVLHRSRVPVVIVPSA